MVPAVLQPIGRLVASVLVPSRLNIAGRATGSTRYTKIGLIQNSIRAAACHPSWLNSQDDRQHHQHRGGQPSAPMTPEVRARSRQSAAGCGGRSVIDLPTSSCHTSCECRSLLMLTMRANLSRVWTKTCLFVNTRWPRPCARARKSVRGSPCTSDDACSTEMPARCRTPTVIRKSLARGGGAQPDGPVIGGYPAAAALQGHRDIVGDAPAPCPRCTAALGPGVFGGRVDLPADLVLGHLQHGHRELRGRGVIDQLRPVADGPRRGSPSRRRA